MVEQIRGTFVTGSLVFYFNGLLPSRRGSRSNEGILRRRAGIDLPNPFFWGSADRGHLIQVAQVSAKKIE